VLPDVFGWMFAVLWCGGAVGMFAGVVSLWLVFNPEAK